jgi:septum formation protein
MSEPLILASASPRRRALLTRLGCPFTVVEARVVEDEDPLLDPRIMVARNAARKADWVAVQHPDAWVLGADTTVCIDGHALNKPADLTEARAMLRRLSGRTHSVFTGLALRRFDRGVEWDATDTCDVTFRELDEARIDRYLSLVHVLDKAGAYGIQDHGELIIAGHTGEVATIMGLPLTLTKHLLTKAGLLT